MPSYMKNHHFCHKVDACCEYAHQRPHVNVIHVTKDPCSSISCIKVSLKKEIFAFDCPPLHTHVGGCNITLLYLYFNGIVLYYLIYAYVFNQYPSFIHLFYSHVKTELGII
ncbi:unnamed protein product [Chrysodeixis includens]|uniref:Uncharacterized protein n=1 Tax=Chrysodeixis includens TaxID=689277 RepID=A0A9N8L618_CHRIL|nr:unnamed protein product [Chrysodeixis includens]